MKKRRKVGRPKKPPGVGSVNISLRINEALLQQLRDAADKAGHSNLSREIAYRLRRSLELDAERERDPALQGLLFLIGQLTERISGGMFVMGDEKLRSDFKKEWRTDLFTFRAVKIAIGKLINALEEPPAEKEVDPQRVANFLKKQGFDLTKMFGGDPEVIKHLMEIYRSPESMANFTFANFWTQMHTSDLRLPEGERELMREHPYLQREHYRLEDARKALELKPKTTKPGEKLKPENGG
jgi:hypothetical protein